MKKARDLLKSIRTNLFASLNQLYKHKMDHSERYSYNPTLQWNPQVQEYFIKAYGSDHFSRISKALTRPSSYSCVRVNTLKTTSNAVIEKLLTILQAKEPKSDFDGKSLNGSSNGSFAEVDMDKNQGSFSKEVNLKQLSDRYTNAAEQLFVERLPSIPVNKCKLPGLDYVLFVKGSGPHVVEYGDQTPKEIIVSRKCAEAVLRGAQVFVPGVLACSAHVEKGDTVAVSVAVEQPGLDNGWGVGITRGIVLHGLETDPHYFVRSGLYIGQGTSMMSRAGIFRASHGIAVEMTNRVFNLPSFHDVLEGEIFLQNLPSIITAHALDPQPGERILDMCAAPGGKTTAIAILMKDEGEIIAIDRSHNKVLDIKKLVVEMGLSCITAYKLDALKAVSQRNESIDLDTQCCSKETLGVSFESSGSSKFPLADMSTVTTKEIHPDKETAINEQSNQRTYLSKADIRKNTRRLRNGPGRNHCIAGRVENSKGFSPDSFDRVLLDAPCSALGLRPRLFAGEETVQSLRSHGKYQRNMFDQAVQLVRPGGVLVYSTCTINPGENEALVRYALDKYKFLSLAPQSPRIGGPGLVGRCELLDGKYTEEWLRPGEEELVQRFDPSSPLDTIGFFVAKFTVGQKDN